MESRYYVINKRLIPSEAVELELIRQGAVPEKVLAEEDLRTGLKELKARIGLFFLNNHLNASSCPMTPEEIAGMIGKMIVINNIKDQNIRLMLVQGERSPVVYVRY